MQNDLQLSRSLKALIVFLIVFSHYLIRDYAGNLIQLDQRSFYSARYATALALVFGKGFTGLRMSDAPEARPITDFLNLRRGSIDNQEIQRYLNSAYSGRPAEEVVSTRILDIRLASLIWKIFGVRWSPVFRFYVLLSSLVCLLIFFMAQKLSGSFWAGCMAAILVAGSFQETTIGTWSLRDASPFWFGSIAFFWLICLTDRTRSKWLNYGSAAVLGAVSLLGYGWRADAAIIPPFILATLVAWVYQKRRSMVYTVTMGVLFAAGALAMRQGIVALGSPDQSVEAEVFFHVADYGNATRSNLLNLENSFQIPRDDAETHVLANFYWSVRHSDKQLPRYLSNLYATACRELYWEYLKYDIFRWYWKFPTFYLSMIREAAFPSSFSPVPITTPGTILAAQPPIITGLSLIATAVFIVGAVPILLVCSERVLAGSLYLFSVYYCVVLVSVLPEGKHLTMLVLPFCVLGGIAAWILLPSLLSFLRPLPPAYYCLAMLFLFWEMPRLSLAMAMSIPAGFLLWYLIQLRRPTKPFESWPVASTHDIVGLAPWVCGVVLIWTGGLVLSYRISKEERTGYIHDITEMAAPPASERPVEDSTYFRVRLQRESPAHGYLIRIRTGEQPGVLVARHIIQNEPIGEKPFRTSFVTRHPLRGNTEQFYYVTLVGGKFGSDQWDCGLFATLEGDAKFLSVRDVDLARWNKPAFGTVFSEEDSSPGSPLIKQPVLATEGEVPIS